MSNRKGWGEGGGGVGGGGGGGERETYFGKQKLKELLEM